MSDEKLQLALFREISSKLSVLTESNCGIRETQGEAADSVPLRDHNLLKEKLAFVEESNVQMREALSLLRENFAKMDEDRTNLMVENESLRRTVVDIELLLDEKSSHLVEIQAKAKYCQVCLQERESNTL